MFDWLHVITRRLGYFIVHSPLYVAGPAMILIGALDSSLLSLPEVNDYLVVARSLRYYTEGTLAVFYGERVVRFLKDNGIIIISVVTGICLIALATYLLSGKGRAAVRLGKETR